MVDKAQYKDLTDSEKDGVAAEFGANPSSLEKILKFPMDEVDTATGLKVPSSIAFTGGMSYRAFYEQQWSAYDMPPSNLHNNKCIGRCPVTFAGVDGICRKCASPCETCRNRVTQCTSCLADVPEKYHYGQRCVVECPRRTITDEVNRRCLGCEDGCEVCDSKNQTKCLECQYDLGLLLYQHTCVKTCPQGYEPNFF
jgi:hypothetical protein